MGDGRLPLFDNSRRIDATPALYQESGFEFLNRIAGDYWGHARALMQEWLDHMTSLQDYNELR